MTDLPYETRQPRIHNEGIWATHDQACAVCHQKPAVMDCQTARFYPCWGCQAKGWELRKRSRLSMKLFGRKEL